MAADHARGDVLVAAGAVAVAAVTEQPAAVAAVRVIHGAIDTVADQAARAVKSEERVDDRVDQSTRAHHPQIAQVVDGGVELVLDQPSEDDLGHRRPGVDVGADLVESVHRRRRIGRSEGVHQRVEGEQLIDVRARRRGGQWAQPEREERPYRRRRADGTKGVRVHSATSRHPPNLSSRMGIPQLRIFDRRSLGMCGSTVRYSPHLPVAVSC
ncbi:hypothetical protein EHH44_21180 [Mycolicibacter terrae]|uniref:Uncharacterized protein n=1 Tax=Mycolicibacter terrae TaxID=1788 RepID=A0ACD2EHE4_9MYCO|nr:hypothetical protein EHH44_21180 [Mycolicibacter terrae]